MFQHTAARRRLGVLLFEGQIRIAVSTHSRPKAAGQSHSTPRRSGNVSTHSRPKAAGTVIGAIHSNNNVSTHSRPKAAGSSTLRITSARSGFNTQPPEGGWLTRSCGQQSLLFVSTHSRPKAAGPINGYSVSVRLFQHTAARRRLVFCTSNISIR